MPQLDTGAFRGQVTWLRRVFLVLYRGRTGESLPKLSQIVKLRAKKENEHEEMRRNTKENEEKLNMDIAEDWEEPQEAHMDCCKKEWRCNKPG